MLPLSTARHHLHIRKSGNHNSELGPGTVRFKERVSSSSRGQHRESDETSPQNPSQVEMVEVLDIVLELLRFPEATSICEDLLEKLKSKDRTSREYLDASALHASLRKFSAAPVAANDAEAAPSAEPVAANAPDATEGSFLQCLEKHAQTLAKRAGARLPPDEEISNDEDTTARQSSKFGNLSIGEHDGSALPPRGSGSSGSPTAQGQGCNGQDHASNGQDAAGDGAQEGSKWPPLLPVVAGSPIRRLHITFDESHKSLAGRAILVLLTLTLAVSTVCFVLEAMPQFQDSPPMCAYLQAHNLPLTVEDCQPRPLDVFWDIETICIVLFTIDYAVRVATAHSAETGRCTFMQGAIRTFWYALQPVNVVDFIAICPYYLELASGDGLGGLEILRLARIMRIFKMARHHPGMKMFAKVLIKSGQPFFILVFFLIIIIMLFASLMYIIEGNNFSVASKFTQEHYIEEDCENSTVFPMGVYVRLSSNPVDGDEPTPFRSIPACMWWVCVTLTTVGYGDISPTTMLGKLTGILCFYVGILFLALPISILGSNFETVYDEEYAQHQPERKRMEISKKWSAKGESSFKDAPWMPKVEGGSLRKKVFIFLEQPSASKLGKIFSVFVLAVIITVTISFVLESMPEFNVTPSHCDLSQLTVQDCTPVPGPGFNDLEVFGITIFTVDYLLRVLTVHVASAEECGVNLGRAASASGLRMTWLYCTQVMNMIDLLAIVPFYVQLGLGGGRGGGMSAIRVVRLLRIFRVLRMRKLQTGVAMFHHVVMDALPAMSLLLFMTMMACLFFASCITYAEGTTYSVDEEWLQKYPNGTFVRPTTDGYNVEESPFRSILDGFWWFFVTATTVGYGDVFPTTTAGRMIGLVTVYVGIVLLALPISVIGSAFGSRYAEWEDELTIMAEASMSPVPSPPCSPSSASTASKIIPPAVPDDRRRQQQGPLAETASPTRSPSSRNDESPVRHNIVMHSESPRSAGESSC